MGTKRKAQDSRSEPSAVTRRLPAAERRAAMLALAAEQFAERGFEIPTRELAKALGVTQALIYKYFDSKDNLIEETLARQFGAARQGPWIDAEAPLAEALPGFYRGFVSGADELRMRLFIRAGLDGRSWPTRRGAALTRQLFLPIIGALRREAGLPGLSARPAMRGERELAMMLHASMVFLGIRRHIYRMPMPDRLDDVVGLYVRTFLAGAVPAIRALHGGGQDSLTVPLAT